MKTTPTAIEGVVIVEPRVFRDHRGSFSETFSERMFAETVAPVRFVQDNESRSAAGVVRGLHFQTGEAAQSKLVRAVEGRILDVAVDMRRSSPTFGKWVAVELSGENGLQLFIPRGLAHGFSVLGERAVVAYKCDNYYAPGTEAGVLWNDPALGIDWGIDPSQAVVAERDAAFPVFAEAYYF